MRLHARWLGRVHYDRALELMMDLASRATRDEGYLLLLEHEPVITMGREFDDSTLLLPPEEYERRGISLRRVGRGGNVTYHGPGQLVGYPIIWVGRNVRSHVRRIFDTLQELLGAAGIVTRFDDLRPGLWVGGSKLAAVGIEVVRGVSTHGFALNVRHEGEGFELIVPCGLDAGVAWWEDFVPPPRLPDIAENFAVRYAARLGASLVWDNLSRHDHRA